jgi:hypothetical protein
MFVALVKPDTNINVGSLEPLYVGHLFFWTNIVYDDEYSIWGIVIICVLSTLSILPSIYTIISVIKIKKWNFKW